MNSNETLIGARGIQSRNGTYQSMSSVGNVRISGGNLLNSNNTIGRGLTFKGVRHNIDRDCMWDHPPDHGKPDWKLKHKNKWRYDVSQFKSRK